MITLKDYAKQHNVTYEAIRSQVNRYREQLGDHIVQDGRQQFLDDYAVAFLDERRQKNPVVTYQQNKDEQIERLENERNLLLAKLSAAHEKNVELMQYKLTNEEQRRALEDAQTAQLRRERELDEREGQLDQQIAEAVQRASDDIRSIVEAENKEIREKAQQIIQETQRRAEEEQSAKDAEIDDLKRKLEAAQQKNQELEDRGLGDYLKSIFTKKRKG